MPGALERFFLAGDVIAWYEAQKARIGEQTRGDAISLLQVLLDETTAHAHKNGYFSSVQGFLAREKNSLDELKTRRKRSLDGLFLKLSQAGF